MICNFLSFLSSSSPGSARSSENQFHGFHGQDKILKSHATKSGVDLAPRAFEASGWMEGVLLSLSIHPTPFDKENHIGVETSN